jgi:5-(carboxyamino)imidazole ribonucleotide mutase
MLANEDAVLRTKLDAFRAAQTEIARGMTLPPVL